MRNYMAERRLDRRIKIIELLGTVCVQCGSVEDVQIDHIIPGSRSFVLSGCGLDKSWAKILEESKKCQLLCKVCHRAKSVEHGEHGGGHNKGKSKYGEPINWNHGTARNYSEGACRCLDCKYAKSKFRQGLIKYNDAVKAPDGYTGRPGRR